MNNKEEAFTTIFQGLTMLQNYLEDFESNTRSRLDKIEDEAINTKNTLKTVAYAILENLG